VDSEINIAETHPLRKLVHPSLYKQDPFMLCHYIIRLKRKNALKDQC